MSIYSNVLELYLWHLLNLPSSVEPGVLKRSLCSVSLLSCCKNHTFHIKMDLQPITPLKVLLPKYTSTHNTKFNVPFPVFSNLISPRLWTRLSCTKLFSINSPSASLPIRQSLSTSTFSFDFNQTQDSPKLMYRSNSLRSAISLANCTCTSLKTLAFSSN